jgi:hypothetical protein
MGGFETRPYTSPPPHFHQPAPGCNFTMNHSNHSSDINHSNHKNHSNQKNHSSDKKLKFPPAPRARYVTDSSAVGVLLLRLYNLTALLLMVTFVVEKNAYFCQILHHKEYW